jgi:hypothetical protein
MNGKPLDAGAERIAQLGDGGAGMGDRLREQQSGAEAEPERQNRDRTELAERLTDFMNDVLIRLRLAPTWRKRPSL